MNRARRRIHEIVEAGQLAKAILTPEFIEARYAMFAIANDVERNNVNLLSLAVQPAHLQVLKEER